jgi:glycerol kinase
MEKKYILSFDQGTSSSRAIIYDRTGKLIEKAQVAFSQFYPKKNWVEQDPWEIFESQISAAKELLRNRKVNVEDIIGLGITNQRETTLIWERSSGEPIYPAIVWQDKRTENQCIKIRNKKGDFIHEKTGLVVDSYFSATKIQWILNNVDGARQKAENGELAFGTVDSWLIWNFTKKQLHITDHSNASRTLLFNINTLEWDDELLELFNIPRSILPQVVESMGLNAFLDESFLGKRLEIGAILGDQQASLFGQTCFKKGMLKSTFGTGSFMLMNTGKKPKFSNNGLLTTIAWSMDGKVKYALEGNIFIAGAAIKWLKDKLQLINSSDESEFMAYSVKDSGGVTVIPALAGLGAPYWNNNVQGAIMGITLGTKREHIVRATLESLAYRTYEMLQLMKEESQLDIKSFSVDGGASVNNFLMQYIADITQIEVNRPKVIETTSLGSAYMAGIALSFWSKEEILAFHNVGRKFVSHIGPDEAQKLYGDWSRLVQLVIKSSEPLGEN